MAATLKLDDRFVHQQLRPVALGWPPLLTQTGTAEDRHLWQVHRTAKDEIDRCLELFDRHRGISPDVPVSADHRLERLFLNYSMSIVGDVLGLDAALPIYRRIIEVDWLAHVELGKEKRYRDHITHPVRVTALGWWLLHRDRERLLADMARRYKKATRSYRVAKGIDLGDHDWEAIVEFAWLACGLLHDSAYPLEYHLRAAVGLRDGYQDPLKIFAPQEHRFAWPRCRRVMLQPLAGSWFADQDLDLDRRMADLARGRKKFKHAHALLGPLHHLHSLAPRLHTLQGLVTQLAARAIVTHHDHDDKAIVVDPLALLLFAADNLQGWQRPFLHTVPPAHQGARLTLQPIVECQCIELVTEGEDYLARFVMNSDRDDQAILREPPYSWRFEAFREPNRRLEKLLGEDPNLPTVVLTRLRCVDRQFLKFMAS